MQGSLSLIYDFYWFALTKVRKGAFRVSQSDNMLFFTPLNVTCRSISYRAVQVVREYKRANMLIRPTPTTARVWVSLYAEIEKVKRQMGSVAK